MIYHLATGDVAAAQLREATILEPSFGGEVIVLRDILNVGPIRKDEGTSFSAMRTAFWQDVAISDKTPAGVNDTERLLEVSKAMFQHAEHQAWVWMAPLPADVCAYYWALKYLKKHAGRFYIVNIAGLPFLDEQGKIYYPKSIGEILPKELIKARRLARPVTASEIETDADEWNRLSQEDGGIRVLEGGKKIASKSETFYDSQLLSFCSHQFQKASRIVSQAMSKYSIPTGDIYLGWRLRKMAEAGALQLAGDLNKSLRDFEVKLPGEEMNGTAGIP